MDQDPRRTGPHPNDSTHLVEWRILEETHVDGFLLATAQGPQGVPQSRIRMVAFRHLHRVGGFRPSETKTSPSALPALMVAGQVDDGLVEPGAEAAHFAWRSRGEPDTHKRLLNDVLGHGVVTDEQGGELRRGAI